MSGALDKLLELLEYLAARPEGASLAAISSDLAQLRSGTHRTLQELVKRGYVRQLPGRTDYALTTRLASMGLSFLSRSGVVDIAQPILDRLAAATEELVRLAIVDESRLTLVAKAQGARSGLMYDPDMGIELRLSCSAAGHAWLMTLSEEDAIAAVTKQGLGQPADFGPGAPTSFKALLKQLGEHRKRGFALVRDIYAPGMSSCAAPVRRSGEATTGVLVVAGPSMRMNEQKMKSFGPDLLEAASELAQAGQASPLLKAANVGTWGNRGQR
jgi:IclR family transcriptional regulator, acetate operon repressor